MTRVMRCRVGLEPDEPAPPDREGPVPDPCKMRKMGGDRVVLVGSEYVIFVIYLEERSEV